MASTSGPVSMSCNEKKRVTMSSFERFLFYARKSVTGIVCTLSNSRLILQAIAAAIGYFSFTSVERQKTNGWTAEWVEKHVVVLVYSF